MGGFFFTFGTQTTFGFDIFIPVFFAIVIAELFAWLNVFDGRNIDATLGSVWFAVGTTGVVDIPSDVFASGAIDMTIARCLKEVSSATTIGLSGSDDFSKVFNDTFPFLDRDLGKETKSIDTFLYSKFFGSRIFRNVFESGHSARIIHATASRYQ